MSIPSIDAAVDRFRIAYDAVRRKELTMASFTAIAREMDSLRATWEGWAKGLFYVCKAMGPPRCIAWRRSDDQDINSLAYPIAARDPVESAAWWAWFDAAQAWVDGID